MTFRNSTRLIGLALALVAMLAISTGVAVAQEDNDYPPPPDETEASIEIQKGAIAPGDIQRIFGQGWAEGSEVTATITYPDGRTEVFSVTAGADGAFTLEFRVPADMPDGETTVTVQGEDRATGQTVFLQETFTIDSALPITGENLSRLTLAAGALLLFGTGMVLYARRRRGVAAA